jgi:hypothetical protein
MFVPNRKHTYGPLRSVMEQLYFLYVDDVPTLQETHLRASTACYEDSSNLLFIILKFGAAAIFVIYIYNMFMLMMYI